MSALPVLIGMSYSPWTAKARWALDHHGVAYRYREHVVMMSMPELRFRTGKWFSGDLTVPALCGKEGVWMDSWNIARHAEEIGNGTPLFGGSDQVAAIERFNAWSEDALGALRGLVTSRIPRDPEACSEALEPIAPKFAHGALGAVVRLGTSYIARQFGVDPSLGEAQHIERIRASCIKFRDALAASGGGYLMGNARGFSYADIILATALQGVKPVEHASLKMGPATRKAWGTPELAQEFSELLVWRDGIYQKHRGQRNLAF